MGFIVEKFRRITSSALYIPEIDGLRFIAIALVVLFHINVFVVGKAQFVDSALAYRFLSAFLNNGWKGVELFFVISGLILSLPFAKHYLSDGKKPEIKKYFQRRLTRLEPPYILSLAAIALLLALKKGFSSGLLHGLFLSFFYIHNFFPSVTAINGVAWSLEIEVQFYILAPLFAYIFLLKAPARRLLLASAMLGMIILQSVYAPGILSIYNYLQYFLLGFILSDLYINGREIVLNRWVSLLAGTAAFSALVFLDISGGSVVNKSLFLAAILLFYALVLKNGLWKRILSIRILTIIGGMCYSLYLIHYVVISAIGNYSIGFQLTPYYLPNLALQLLVLIPAILLASGIFFVLIERPCMDSRWPAKLKGCLRNHRVWPPFRQEAGEDIALK